MIKFSCFQAQPFFFFDHQTHSLRCDSRRYRGESARREFKHATAPAKKGGGARRSHPRDTPGWTYPPVRRRPQASRSPLVDFSSRSTPVGAVSDVAPRSPKTRGHAGLVRRARTYPWWETTGQFSPPKPRRTWVTIGLLPACIPGTPRGPPVATGAIYIFK